ncbi:MAG: glycosyltransferase family 2 protein [Bacteroidota bacterium]
MKIPFFSIVIPVYNRSAIFEQRLTYLLQQEFTDYEVIIVDDGSTDHPEEKLKKFFAEYPFIRIISQVNSERGAARNNGIRNSTGEYIVLFDSDDFMHKDHLEKLHRGIIKNNYPDFIATKFNFRNEEGKVYRSGLEKYNAGIYDYALFLEGNPVACNICFKKSLKDLKYFVEDRNFAIKEDWMFLISNMRNHKLVLLDDVTISMYDHADRSMKSDNRLIVQRTIKATEWIKDHVELKDAELKKLYAHRNYFCGIHSYLDGERIPAIRYALKAIFKGGLKKNYLVLFVKSILGRKLILKIK